MKRSIFASIFALAFVAGCSATGTTPSIPTGSAQGKTAQAQIVIVVPSATTQAAKRSPQYVSPATGSLSFQLSNQMSEQVAPLAGPNCSTSNGSQTCTLTFNATVGSGLTLTVKAFNSTDGTGSILSLNTVPVNIVADQINVINITLDGVVASFALSLNPTNLTPGSSGTVTATYTAYDAQGYAIVGSAPLVNASNNTIAPVLTSNPAGGSTSFPASPTNNAWAVTETNPSAGSIVFTVAGGPATSGSATLTVANATPTPSPSPTPTASPTPGGNACQQAWSSSAPSGLSNVVSTFFTTIIPNGHNICTSAWDYSSQMTASLVQAAKNGANVWALAPYSERSSNSSYAQQIVNAGGHWIDEYTSSFSPITTGGALETGIKSPMDIHSKFALVDGVAYLDGHNWFSTDVIMRDGSQGDYSVIENNLSTFATPAPSNGSFTSDKQVSLASEYAYLQSVLPSVTSTSEFDWSSESYNPNPATGNYNDEVFAGLCAIATSPAHPVMKFYVESYPYNANAGVDIQYMVSFNPNSQIYSSSSGLEKVAMLRSTVGGNASTVWFGSSNATTTDLFDWGMDITDSGMITALQQWFDSGISGKTAVAKTTPTISSCPTTSP